MISKASLHRKTPYYQKGALTNKCCFAALYENLVMFFLI